MEPIIMAIININLKTGEHSPSKNLSQDKDIRTHITISYDITGDRDKVDRQIELAIENDKELQKIEHVDTVLYWQPKLNDLTLSDIQRNSNIEAILKKKLKEIFVNEKNLSGVTVTAFCMVGNIRAFAFKIDA